ncbi:MAG: ABC transporter substrate-binding protein [Deltaproteobacteria bacterium]
MRRALGGLSLCLVCGCGAATGPSKTITVGAVLSQTGQLADIGAGELQAVNLAVSQINAQGGVLGGQLAVAARDDGSDADAGVAAAAGLAALGVPALIGSVASGVTIPIAEEVTIPDGIVQISGASTSPAYTALHADGGTTFRTCPSDALQGKVLAEQARSKGDSNVAALFVPGPYGQGLATEFSAAFTAAGGTVVGMLPYAPGLTDQSSLLAQVYAMGPTPQAILLVAYPEDGATILKDYLASDSGKGTFWFFTDSLDDPAFVAGLGASDFTFQHEGTTPSTPKGSRYQDFANAFEALYGSAPPEWSANAYDAVYLIALAMTAAGKSDSAAIKAALPAVSAGPGTLYGATDYAQAVADLKAGKGVNYDGASGPVDFDSNGDVTGAYDIWQVQNGQFTTLESNVSP